MRGSEPRWPWGGQGQCPSPRPDVSPASPHPSAEQAANDSRRVNFLLILLCFAVSPHLPYNVK